MLLDPVNPESKEELYLRESILRILAEGFDEAMAKKALNLLTALIGERSKAFETALKVILRSVDLHRLSR